MANASQFLMHSDSRAPSVKFHIIFILSICSLVDFNLEYAIEALEERANCVRYDEGGCWAMGYWRCLCACCLVVFFLLVVVEIVLVADFP